MSRGRPCTICQHPARAEIDKALRERTAMGDSYQMIADRFLVERKPLAYHEQNHMGECGDMAVPSTGMPAEVREFNPLEYVASLRARLFDYEERTQTLLVMLEDVFNDPLQLFVIQTMRGKEDAPDVPPGIKIAFAADPLLRTLSELRKFIETAGRLAETEAAIRIKLEEMRRKERKVDVLDSPEWKQLRDGLLAVLERYPEALAAVRVFLAGGVIDVTPNEEDIGSRG